MVGANLHKGMLKRSWSCEPNGLFRVGFNGGSFRQRLMAAGKSVGRLPMPSKRRDNL